MSSEGPPLTPEFLAQDKGPTILWTCWVFTAISTLFVIARVYVRAGLMRQLHSDDYFTILAQICGIASSAVSTVAVWYGGGKHMAVLSSQQQSYTILWTSVGFCPGIFTIGLPKLAVVALLCRLLNPPRWQKWFMWWMAIWCQLGLLATVGLLFGRCLPARATWDVTTPGVCWDALILVNYCFYGASFCVFVDIYLSLYPTIVLAKLQMPIKKKTALCIALGLGWISGAIGMYKVTTLSKLASLDFSYDATDITIWTIIEGSVIIIASTIPLLQPLLDIVARHNPLSYHHHTTSSSDDQTPQYYEDYSKQSGAGHKDIELGQRKTKKKKRDEFNMTVMSTINMTRNCDDDRGRGEDGGSQEDILTPNHNLKGVKEQDESTSDGDGGDDHDTMVKADRDSKQQHLEGQIVRTDVVMVEFDRQSGRRDTTASKRWRPV